MALCEDEKMKEKVKIKPVPKIKAGGIPRPVLYWGLAVILIFGSIAGAGTYHKAFVKNSPEKVKIMRHTGKIDMADWLTEPEPEPEPEPVEEIVIETPIAEPVPEKIQNVMVASLPPKAAQLFNTLPPQGESMVGRFNAVRRGSVDLKVSKDIYGTTKKTDYIMDQEKWDQEEIKASFPIDMSRVIPVYMTIPATLIQAIDSEISGKVVAQINQNIYGGQGRTILIPAGSHATGYFTPLAKYGDERISITWKMIDTPEGIRIYTVNAETADAMGRSGITGILDNRNWEKYGIPILVSTFQMASAYAFPVKSDSQRILVEGSGSSLASMGQSVLDENMNLKPKIQLPAGEQIIISPMKDIRFPKPIQRIIQAVAVEN